MFELQPWHWITIGVLCLSLETQGFAGFLLGVSIAAFVQAVFLWIFPDASWQLQLAMFAIDAIIFSVLYWKVFKQFNNKTDNAQLNDRAGTLVGRKFVLEESLPSGEGKIQVGDTFWRVRASGPLEEKTNIKVVATEGMILLVEKIED